MKDIEISGSIEYIGIDDKEKIHSFEQITDLAGTLKESGLKAVKEFMLVSNKDTDKSEKDISDSFNE